MKRFVSVTAIQMEINPLDVAANLQKAEELLVQALKESKVDLVVFPEYFINGVIDKFIHEEDEEISFFKRLALKYNVFIVCGSFAKKSEGKIYNTSLLISDKGEILLKYFKNHLWHPERKLLTSGDEVLVVQTKLGKISIVICWDLAFSEIFQRLQKQKVDIICIPSYWTTQDGGILRKKYTNDAEKNFVNSLCPARAIEFNSLIVYANGAGTAKVPLKTKMWTAEQIGQSQICAPVFGCVKKIDDNQEGYISYKFDRNIAKDAERRYKIRKDILV